MWTERCLPRIPAAGSGSRPASFARISSQWAGDDHEEDVRDHDRAEHRPELEPDGPIGVDEAEPVGGDRGERDEDGREDEVVPEHAAETVVDEPGDGEECDREHDAPRLAEARLDEVDVGVDVVEDAHQREAREPRRVRLPLEPVEGLRQRLRRDLELLDEVEATAVDFPRLAPDAGLDVLRLRRRVEMVVESHEVERRPDPDDARDHVEPAEQEVEPVDQVRINGDGHPRLQRSVAIATSSAIAVSSSSSRGRSRRSWSTGTISRRGRPLTKTTKRKPNFLS